MSKKSNLIDIAEQIIGFSFTGKLFIFMMFISLIALVVKSKRFGPKIFSLFLEVNQVKLTFSRGQSPRAPRQQRY